MPHAAWRIQAKPDLIPGVRKNLSRRSHARSHVFFSLFTTHQKRRVLPFLFCLDTDKIASLEWIPAVRGVTGKQGNFPVLLIFLANRESYPTLSISFSDP